MSEYFRSLIQEAQEHQAHARLGALLLERLKSKDIKISEGFWDELKGNAKVLIRKYAQRKERKTGRSVLLRPSAHYSTYSLIYSEPYQDHLDFIDKRETVTLPLAFSPHNS